MTDPKSPWQRGSNESTNGCCDSTCPDSSTSGPGRSRPQGGMINFVRATLASPSGRLSSTDPVGSVRGLAGDAHTAAEVSEGHQHRKHRATGLL